MPIIQTDAAGEFAIKGEHTGGGAGIKGTSAKFVGVWGQSDSPDQPGVLGTSTKWQGVCGKSVNQAGVVGVSAKFVAIWGESPENTGVFGKSVKAVGVHGKSDKWRGMLGESTDNVGVVGLSTNFVGIWGESPANSGVFGKSVKSNGVHGQSDKSRGVLGESTDNAGVVGVSKKFVGIWAETHAASQCALFAKGPKLAGRFEGDVEVTGDITLANADCAEDFDVVSHALAEPGNVMVLGEDGMLHPCSSAYDKRVAGVVSGAGSYRPGMILDRRDSDAIRRPVALLGKAFCKATTLNGPIEIGDLLTTSPIEGHAMKASDPREAFGAVIGKAMRSLPEGEGLVPILIGLQ